MESKGSFAVCSTLPQYYQLPTRWNTTKHRFAGTCLTGKLYSSLFCTVLDQLLIVASLRCLIHLVALVLSSTDVEQECQGNYTQVSRLRTNVQRSGNGCYTDRNMTGRKA